MAGEALVAFRVRNDTQTIALILGNMAAYRVTLQRYGEARTHAQEALTLGRDLSEVHLVFTLQHLAAVEAFRPGEGVAPAVLQAPDRTRAARLLGYVDARLTALEALRDYTEQREYDKMLVVLADALGEEQLAMLMDEGHAWSEDQAVAEALLA